MSVFISYIASYTTYTDETIPAGTYYDQSLWKTQLVEDDGGELQEGTAVSGDVASGAVIDDNDPY